MRTLRQIVGHIGAAMAMAAIWAVGCNVAGETELMCEPGENIFCRCRGGEAGTKACRDDGRGFDACFDSAGACEESFGSAETADSDLKQLLEPCEKGNECTSGLCSMGYCTLECGMWQECTDEAAGIYGDCVNIGPLQQCVPYCGSQADCETYGSLSGCGYAQAVDAVGVVVCADFGQLPLPPEGSPCVDDFECHLGIAGAVRVCEFEVCVGGCHEDDDCLEGATCTSGAPGFCSPSP